MSTRKPPRRPRPPNAPSVQTFDPKHPARVEVARFGGARFFLRYEPGQAPKLEIDLTGVSPALRARAELLRAQLEE